MECDHPVRTANTAPRRGAGRGSCYGHRIAPYIACMLCAGHSALAWCRSCHRDMRATGSRCPQCARATPASGSCGPCLSKPPAFDRCRALYVYNTLSAVLIHCYKYHARDGLAGSFAAYFAGAMAADSDNRKPQILIPIPLHWRRQIRRGFNQSQWLAKKLAGRTGIPCRERILVRQRATLSQTHLSGSARRSNLYRAFTRCEPLPEGVRVLLVDDVLTTGATAHEAAKTLKRQGASEVELWVLARAEAPGTAFS